ILRALYSFPTRRSSDLFESFSSSYPTFHLPQLKRACVDSSGASRATKPFVPISVLSKKKSPRAANSASSAKSKTVTATAPGPKRSEEHTSELQSRVDLV